MYTSRTMIIDRPIREVFALVSEPWGLSLWVSGIGTVHRPPGAVMGLGTRLEATHVTGGRPHGDCWEVIEYEPPRAIALRLLGNGAPTQARLTLESASGATRLRLEVYLGTNTPSGASPQPGADLEALRELLESENTMPGQKREMAPMAV